MRSRSNGRGSFRTFLGRRPNSRSKSWRFARSDSGVSCSRGRKTATALMNSGEPGGQSIGWERQSEEVRNSFGSRARGRRRSMAARMRDFESPWFEPRATIASRSDWVKEGGNGREETSAGAPIARWAGQQRRALGVENDLGLGQGRRHDLDPGLAEILGIGKLGEPLAGLYIVR